MSQTIDPRPTTPFLKSLPRQLPPNPKLKADLTHTQYPILRTVIASFQYQLWRRTQQKEAASLVWVDTYLNEETIRRMKPYQRINHFAGSEELGRKDRLAVNLMKARAVMPDVFNYFPQTWLLPRDLSQFQKYVAPGKVFIAKPQADSQGRGIFLFQSPQQLKPNAPPLVIQQYLCNPFLLDCLKFDFRLYVLLRSLSPLRIFLYQQGLTRLATCPYQPPSPSNLDNHTMHLTNYAINKRSQEFVFNTSEERDDVGHKRSYSAVMRRIKEMGYDTGKLQREVEMLVVRTLMAAEGSMVQADKECKREGDSVCFQLLGFDIMLDQNLKPHLLQVNHSPSFSTDTPLDLLIKKHLLLDTINMLHLTYTHKQDYLTKKDAPSPTIQEDIKWQDAHLGGFKKLYPCVEPGLQREYERIRHSLAGKKKYKGQKMSLPRPEWAQISQLMNKTDAFRQTARGCYRISQLSDTLRSRSKADKSDLPAKPPVLKLASILFETIPDRSPIASASSQFRLFRQQQQTDEDFTMFQRPIKKANLFNFEQNINMQKRFRQAESRIAADVFVGLNYSYEHPNKFNAMRHRNHTSKARFKSHVRGWSLGPPTL